MIEIPNPNIPLNGNYNNPNYNANYNNPNANFSPNVAFTPNNNNNYSATT